MEFNKSYDRQEFVHFLKNSFLPEDFVQIEEDVEFRTKTQYSTHAVKLGSSETLDLVVFEIRHNSRNDARVSLSKEAFRLLADEMEDRALVVFVPEDNNALYRFSFIEITLSIDEDSSRVTRTYSNPRRYSYLLGEGISYYTPNKYLNEKGRVVNDEDLHERFSVEVLTNDFYEELSDWFAWAITQIKFPNDIEDKNDDEKYNNECAIRLITRLMFVWFLKQRHLIPEEFFDEKFIAEHLLKDFAPNKTEGFYKQKSLESKYYKAILQNLFFAMLNRPICEEGSTKLDGRRFRKADGDFNINYLMRYEKYFKNTQLFIDLANKTVPFLNGGLFDCLDDKDKGEYYDCFTDRKAINQFLCFPDYLFFGDEAGKNIDLSEFYGDKKKKKVSARGIIDILKRYNFTVEENTPFDKEVSLDPELLGKAFENLLAAYNPETQTTARKQTGSFYTPREIVQYMVDESLVAHLKRTVGDELETEYRKLLHYTDEPFNLNEQQRHAIMQSLFNCKILDPACGSGAFPMGILQQMVHILQRIDPDNSRWKEMMLNQAVGETKAAFMNDISDERHELLNDIERNFDERINRPDYARKLYLIENCIYGVDIQPIAIQISKLRFFISLVVDQKTNDDPTDNFGIRPLPNLEAKFVAANTLIGLEKIAASLFDTEIVKKKEEEMKEARHKIFGAKTVKTKRKYRQRIADIRQELSDILEMSGAVGNEGAKLLNSWDMFDQNASSPFFDPEWMFGIKEGFDIVIGNPPYINAKEQIKKEELRLLREHLKKDNRYETLYQKWDIFIPFMEVGIKYLCCEDGLLSMIVPYPLSNQLYAQQLRRMIINEYDLIEVVDLYGVKVFENATVTNCIPFIRKSHTINKVKISHADKSKQIYPLFEQPIENIVQDPSTFVWNFTQEKRIGKRHPHMHVLGDICYISKGMVLNSDEKIAKGAFKKADLISSSEDLIHNKKYIEAKDLDKYTIKRFRFLEWNTERCPDQLSRPTFPELYTTKKLLINCLGDMKVAIDDGQQLYCEQGIRMALLWKDLNNVNNKSIESSVKKYSTMSRYDMSILSEEIELKFLLAILNSKYATTLLSDIRGGDYHIVPEHIRNIPIPTVSINIQKVVIGIVDQILEAKKVDFLADTSVLEKQIDMWIYYLYGLSYNDIVLIDQNTTITLNEYNNFIKSDED